MAFIVADRVKETTATSGTGDYALGGAATGFQAFSVVTSNTDTVYYAVSDNVYWEVGVGTYASSGNSITRTTILASSNSGSAVNWGVGTKDIFLTYPAEKAVVEDVSNNVTIGNNLVVGGTVDGVDIAARDAVLTSTTDTANAALPKAGGAMTGAITTNSTFDGRDVATDGTKLDTVETNADVTDTANVASAGALMDSEVDADIKTLVLPANTTISTFGGSLVDDADAAAARTTLGVAIGSNVQAYSSILQNTTASFLSADETKLDYISVTQAVDLDQMETDIAALANGMVYKGNWDASSGSFPGGGSAQTGWFYYVSVAGTVGGVSFAIGDNIVATTDNASASTFAGNWSKHDQTDAVQAVVGLTGSIAKSALLSALNVEDGADVTDVTNVTAAGALMDSEVTNLAQVKAFDEADYATAAQGTLAANALPKSGGALTGAVTTNSTFDGRDVSVDGTKLDGIATGATAYSNADVDSHVNVSTATASQVLSWTGSDYDWVTPSSASGDLLAANNLSDLANAATARTNLDVDQAGTALAFAIALG